MDAPEPRTLTVPEHLAGVRLDSALTELLGGLSRVRVQELIRDGGVQIQGQSSVRASLPVEPDWRIDILAVERSRVRPGSSPDRRPRVVHEDEHLVVLDKPAGMVTHPSSVVRGGTLSEHATALFGALPTPQGEDRPGIVHRLDADTSGLIVLARSERAAAALMEMFQARRVRKGYRAVVFGEPRFDSDWIDTPIGRSSGRADRMAVVADPARGREASTFYRTLERFDGFGFVACEPKTGRTHQLRVHLASIDHPLVGDRVYRGRRGLSRAIPRGAPPAGRHLLHAQELGFAHPVSGVDLAFEAQPPADFEAWLGWLRGRAARG